MKAKIVKKTAPAAKAIDLRKAAVTKKNRDGLKAGLQTAARPRPSVKLWQLRLYVTGRTVKSQTAFANLKQVCETNLRGSYHITVIDLLRQPQLAKGDQILAVPTVVRLLPKPVRTIIGTLSDTTRLLVGLDLRPADLPG